MVFPDVSRVLIAQTSPTTKLCISLTAHPNPLSLFSTPSCTIYANYVSPDVLASVYPLLTMNSKALITHGSVTPHPNDVTATIHLLRQHHFSYAFHPSAWLPTAPNHPDCHPHLLLCPTLTRRLTDSASFLTAVDPLTNPLRLLLNFQLPYTLANPSPCLNNHKSRLTRSNSEPCLSSPSPIFTPIKYGDM